MISHGTAEQMLDAFQQRLEVLDTTSSDVDSATSIKAAVKPRKKNSTHGTADQMINAFEKKIAQLEGNVDASCKVEAADEVAADRDEASDERFIHTLIGDTNTELEDLDIFDSWEWEDRDEELVLTTVKDDQVNEYTVPKEDLSFDWDKMEEDVQYIIEAITDTEDIESVTSATVVEAADDKSVVIPEYAKYEFYRDSQGEFGGDADDIYSLEDLMIMWNSEHNNDPVMEQCSSFEEWWADTVQFLTPVVNNTAINAAEDYGYYYGDEDEPYDEYDEPGKGFTEIASKQVQDSDGFYTDYTMYRDIETGEYVFVFGDRDMYTPESGGFDWSCDTEQEAWEWFNDYHGFGEDDDEDDVYSATSISASTYTAESILSYLKTNKDSDCTLTDDELSHMADIIYRVAKEEEGMSGEDYESIEDIDIGGLIDSSTDELHDLGYNWLGLLDEDDVYSATKIQGGASHPLPYESFGDDLTLMFNDCPYDVIDAGYTDDGEVIVTLNHQVRDVESAARAIRSILDQNGIHATDWNVNGSNVFLFPWIDANEYESMQEENAVYNATALYQNPYKEEEESDTDDTI